ncbi:MAG TPA: hypothetical protein VII49_12400, partial [Rhizomicrobium sp.]
LALCTLTFVSAIETRTLCDFDTRFDTRFLRGCQRISAISGDHKMLGNADLTKRSEHTRTNANDGEC